MKRAIPNLKNKLYELKSNYMKYILFSMGNKKLLYAIKIDRTRE
jgi:hypothetical protein